MGPSAQAPPLRSIALTGALGFVASHLIPRLQPRHRLIAVVRPGRDASRLAHAGLEIREADLDQPDERLPAAFAGADAVVHLSGMAQAVALVPALERAGVARGVFISSAGVHTRLQSSGADRKRAGEAALRGSSIAYTILRPSMIYGTPADRNLVRLLCWVRRFPAVFLPGGGHTLQQPVHVEDLADAIVAALSRPEAARREYDVGGPEALSLREVTRIAGECMGRRVLLVPLPLGPAHGLVVALRKAGLPSPVRPEQVLRLAESKAVDIAAARRDLGFMPRPFREGIAAEARMLLGGDRVG
jgi:uncharacterized protein YbjT (DUF2867 family)